MPLLLFDLFTFIMIIYFIYLFFSKGNYIFKIMIVVGIFSVIAPGFGPFLVAFLEGILKLLWEIFLAILPEFLF